MILIESLLREISDLYKKAEEDRQEREKQGDFFNVFNTIGLRTEEVRLHSAFIAELLNPQGKHGLSHLFLEAFLEMLKSSGYLDFSKVSQDNKERYIGRLTETEGGRVDIIIEDGNHAVIIENKIYAEDQTNQMLRYYNYGKAEYKDGFKLIYLTLDGHEPSECSLGNEQFTYDCWSYDNDIVKWLEKCIRIADSKQKSLVKSVIIQYKELVKQITNTDMDKKYSKQLLNTMLKSENLIAVGEMLSVQDDWFEKVICKYIWEPLEEFAKEKGMNFGVNKESNAGEFWVYKKEWKHYGIFVTTDRRKGWSDMYVGVSYFGDCPRKRSERIFKKDYKNSQLECLNGCQNDNLPYGWEFLRDDIMNWNCYIIKEIVSGTVADYIKDKFEMILQEIEDKQLKML